VQEQSRLKATVTLKPSGFSLKSMYWLTFGHQKIRLGTWGGCQTMVTMSPSFAVHAMSRYKQWCFMTGVKISI
jgi:hypothetical protein